MVQTVPANCVDNTLKIWWHNTKQVLTSILTMLRDYVNVVDTFGYKRSLVVFDSVFYISNQTDIVNQ